MKPVIFSFLFFCTAFSANAQHTTRVQLQAGSSRTNTDSTVGHGFFDNAINAGISAEQRIYKGIYVKATYRQWFNTSKYGPTGFQDNFSGSDGPSELRLSYRENYRTAELLAGYRFSLRHHEVFGAAGLTYTAGDDVYSIAYGCFWDNYIKANDMYGMIWEAGYNYRPGKGRINVGPSVTGSYYGEVRELNLKLNIGYNFSLKRR